MKKLFLLFLWLFCAGQVTYAQNDHKWHKLIGHDPKKGKEWLEKGARYEVTDVLDSKRLRELFAQGRRLFILNPPAPPSSDTVIEERKVSFPSCAP
ncbi:MAG TPA: hypothetical protein VK668_24455 [Mucilaginibacter sp.]|nr:hypothetical protein [Mucilaginibacter sp.]